MARKRGVGAAISDLDLLGRGGDPPPLRLANKPKKDGPAEAEAAEEPAQQAANGANPKAQPTPEPSPANGASANGSGAAEAAAALLEGEPVAVEAPAPKPTPAEPESSTPKRPRRRKRREEVDVGVELYLPEDLLFRARSLVRPQRTGARRSLGAAFVLRAYVRAVDEILDGELDVQGIEQGADEEMLERVKAALERRLGGG